MGMSEKRKGGDRAAKAAGCGSDCGTLVPNATTIEAIEAARRGDLVELGNPEAVLAELSRED